MVAGPIAWGGQSVACRRIGAWLVPIPLRAASNFLFFIGRFSFGSEWLSSERLIRLLLSRVKVTFLAWPIRAVTLSHGEAAPKRWGVNPPECRGAVGSSSRERCLNIDRLDSRFDQRQTFETISPRKLSYRINITSKKPSALTPGFVKWIMRCNTHAQECYQHDRQNH
jgi:hypothetical protein